MCTHSCKPNALVADSQPSTLARRDELLLHTNSFAGFLITPIKGQQGLETELGVGAGVKSVTEKRVVKLTKLGWKK